MSESIFKPVQECMHCDQPFSESYLKWHAARAVQRKDGLAILTCKKCGCWTPVRFWMQLVNPMEAQSA